MKFRVILFFIVIVSIACQVIPTPPPLERTPFYRKSQQSVSTSTDQNVTHTPTSILTLTSPTNKIPGEMPAFPTNKNIPFSNVEVSYWKPVNNYSEEVKLPISLDSVANSKVVSGLTSQQRRFLERNGFVAIRSGDSHFSDIRERVSSRYGQPYYLTSDAAFHALHLMLSDLFVGIEKYELYPQITAVVRATLDEALSYVSFVSGTDLELDTHLAVAYLGVALKLFDPQCTLDICMMDQVNTQIEQIMAAEGSQESNLIPGFVDDFRAYIPSGHYEGDPDLEAYFRGLTWLNRVQFKIDIEDSSVGASRIPLIITLALRRATIGDRPASEEWSSIHEIRNFILGPSNQNGPIEYAGLMDQIYGSGLTIIGLQDEQGWQEFLSMGINLLQTNSSYVVSESNSVMAQGQGWSFIDQGYGLDTFILQSLFDERVADQGNKLQLPGGLDVTAILGSQTALDIMSVDQRDFAENQKRLINAINSLPLEVWLRDIRSSWLYALFPLLEEKGNMYPAYMRTSFWSYKELNSALGAWVELKHEANGFISTKELVQEEDAPVSNPAPCYVEPNPDIFYRLSYIAIALVDGIDKRGLPSGDTAKKSEVSEHIKSMEKLGLRLQQLGDIAAKQLNNMTLDENDRLICLTSFSASEARGHGHSVMSPSTEVISLISYVNGDYLYAGIGSLDRIYVLVPFEDGVQIAQGGVFSYYEFPWSNDELTTDSKWKYLLEYAQPERPKWVENFVFTDGYSVDVLAFRVGDIYMITQNADQLNIREEPSLSAHSIKRLRSGEYLEIIDGPIQAEGYLWWKFKLIHSGEDTIQGWAIENQDYYERSWR